MNVWEVLKKCFLLYCVYSIFIPDVYCFRFDEYPYYVEREWWKEGKRMTFWSTWRMLRDVKRRRLLQELGPDRMRLKALKFNTILPQAIRDECAEQLHSLPKASCPSLILNMCQFTGRQRGKIKRFRVNRHIFRCVFACHLFSSLWSKFLLLPWTRSSPEFSVSLANFHAVKVHCFLGPFIFKEIFF